MAVKFLIDENSWRKALVGGLKRAHPELDVVHIGEAGAPSNEAALTAYILQEKCLAGSTAAP